MVGEEVGHVPFLSVSLFVSLSSALPLHQYCKYVYMYKLYTSEDALRVVLPHLKSRRTAVASQQRDSIYV